MTRVPNHHNPYVGEMDENKTWSITLSYHDKNEIPYVENIIRFCPTITEAIESACEAIEEIAELYGWSDWIITGANIVPEIH